MGGRWFSAIVIAMLVLVGCGTSEPSLPSTEEAVEQLPEESLPPEQRPEVAEPEVLAPDASLSQNPVLWVSDLYDPADDPDDHYDFAVGLSDPLMRPGMFVLDGSLGPQPVNAPAIEELVNLTGLPGPEVVLASDVEALDTWVAAQPDGSIDIVSVGSLTPIAALLDRIPDVLRAKVRQVLIIAGNARPSDISEHNVRLDPEAFLRVMSSDLPIRWVPAFDGQDYAAGTSSYTVTTDEALLAGVNPNIRSWFERYVSNQWGSRALWGAALIIDQNPPGAEWEVSEVPFNAIGGVQEYGGWVAKVDRLVVTDREVFEEWMVTRTNEALRMLQPVTSQ
jgi:hypothetical protein